MQQSESNYKFNLTELLALIVLLYLGSAVFIPLAFAGLCALSIFPAVVFLEKKGFSRSLAIIPPILLLILLMISALGLLYWIVNDISMRLPTLWPLLESSLMKYSQKLEADWNISVAQQIEFIKNQIDYFKNNAGSIFLFSLSRTAEGLVYVILIPILIFFQLYYRKKLLKFLVQKLPESYQSKVYPAAHKAVFTFYRYLQGLILVYISVGILNTIGLWIIGIPDAAVFGFIAAILTAIPFVGIMIGSIPPLVISIVMYESWLYPAGVIATFTLVQYLEANLIFPLVVGNRLQLNPFAVIIVMLSGAILWGASGLIIFLPALAIFKVIAGDIDKLKSWAELLGNDSESK